MITTLTFYTAGNNAPTSIGEPSALILESLTGLTEDERNGSGSKDPFPPQKLSETCYEFYADTGNCGIPTSTIDVATIEAYKKDYPDGVPESFLLSDGEQYINYDNSIRRLVQLPCNNVDVINAVTIDSDQGAESIVEVVSKHCDFLARSSDVSVQYVDIAATVEKFASVKAETNVGYPFTPTERAYVIKDTLDTLSNMVAEHLHSTVLKGVKADFTELEYATMANGIALKLLDKFITSKG